MFVFGKYSVVYLSIDLVPQSSSKQETDSIREVKQDIKARVAEVPLLMRVSVGKKGDAERSS